MIPLDQKAFDTIVEKLGATLIAQEFTRAADENADGVRRAVFVSGSLAYAVTYTMSTKRMELCTCATADSEGEKKWKTISSWLYDPQPGEDGDLESIVNDFIETVEGPKRVAAVQTANKKRAKGDENNADPVFMFNRFSGVFSDLRGDLIEERSKYGTVRPIAFMRGSIVPRVQKTLAAPANEAQLQKLAELCSDLYENGDFDVRSILTMVLLNSLDEAAVREKLVPLFSEDLQKAYKSGLKLRGKKVKPEKVKKQSRVVAEALKNTQGR